MTDNPPYRAESGITI